MTVDIIVPLIPFFFSTQMARRFTYGALHTQAQRLWKMLVKKRWTTKKKF